MLLERMVALGTIIVSQSRVSIDRVAPADLPHLALLAVLELHPVADADRVVELQGQAADDVGERVLERERGDGGEQRRGGQDAGELDAQAAQGEHHRGHRAEDEHQAGEEGPEADPERRQPEVEDQQHRQVDGGEQAAELGDLVGDDGRGRQAEQGEDPPGGAGEHVEERGHRRVAHVAPLGGREAVGEEGDDDDRRRHHADRHARRELVARRHRRTLPRSGATFAGARSPASWSRRAAARGRRAGRRARPGARAGRRP